MAYSCKIDGSDVAIWETLEWEERYTPFDDLSGRHVASAFYTAIARFNALTTSEFSAWSAACDGGTHTFTCPSPVDPETNVTFTGVKIIYLGANIETGIYYGGAAFRIIRMNRLSIPLFGAIATS